MAAGQPGHDVRVGHAGQLGHLGQNTKVPQVPLLPIGWLYFDQPDRVRHGAEAAQFCTKSAHVCTRSIHMGGIGMTFTRLNVSLSKPMRTFVEYRTGALGFASVSEYFRELVRRDEYLAQQEYERYLERNSSPGHPRRAVDHPAR